MIKHKSIEWQFDGQCIRVTSHASSGFGYPRIKLNGKRKSIARHIVFRRHGELDDKTVTRHTCDHPWCVNPDHLLMGTQRDNMQDATDRNRYACVKGELNGRCKLTESDVSAIRSSIDSCNMLASHYGVSKSTIYHVKKSRTWSHIL